MSVGKGEINGGESALHGIGPLEGDIYYLDRSLVGMGVERKT